MFQLSIFFFFLRDWLIKFKYCFGLAELHNETLSKSFVFVDKHIFRTDVFNSSSDTVVALQALQEILDAYWMSASLLAAKWLLNTFFQVRSYHQDIAR